MAANVETMFYVREKPWHGLGTEVKSAPTSAEGCLHRGRFHDLRLQGQDPQHR